MTPAEAAELLTLAAAFDRRTIGKADVAAWHLALAGFDLADARDALIAHFRDSRDWLMPVDLVTRCRVIRADRVARNTPLDLPAGVDPDDPVAVQRATRDQRRAAADRQVPSQVRELAARLGIDRVPGPRCEHGQILGVRCCHTVQADGANDEAAI
jgi:hypothetical protein